MTEEAKPDAVTKTRVLESKLVKLLLAVILVVLGAYIPVLLGGKAPETTIVIADVLEAVEAVEAEEAAKVEEAPVADPVADPDSVPEAPAP